MVKRKRDSTRKFWSLCKISGIADIGCKQSVRDRRELGSHEKVLRCRCGWGCLKVVYSNLLAVLSDAISDVIVKMKDVVSSALAFTSNCNIFSEVGKLLQLMHVLPVTTASAERSFSSLRRLKMYFRTTMSTQRLNHLMPLWVHRCCTESLNVQKIISEFVSRNQELWIVFGNVWSVSDYVFLSTNSTTLLLFSKKIMVELWCLSNTDHSLFSSNS